MLAARRRLSLLVLAAAALGATASTASAAPGWRSPVTLPGVTAKATDRPGLLRFDAAGNGIAEWTNGTAGLSNTVNGGASWAAGSKPQFVPDEIAFGLDGAGNRVYAYATSSSLRIIRLGPSGVPLSSAPVAGTFADVPADANKISLAVNAAGDVLAGWSSQNTSDETGIVFWPHGQAAPNPRQLMPVLPGKSSATPFAVLDPDRRATFAYQQDGHLVQVTSTDAASVPFSPPVTLSAGNVGGMTGGQAPDGRAAIAWYEYRTITPNQYGANMAFELFAASRGPGQAFAGVHQVDGSPDIEAGYSGLNEVAVAPTGRAIIGYSRRSNRAGSVTCEQTLGQHNAMAAVAQVTAQGAAIFAPHVLAGGGQVDARSTARVAAGPDGRLAATWIALNGCGNASTISFGGAALSLPVAGQPDAYTPLIGLTPPPLFPGVLGFRADGQLVALGAPSAVFAGQLSSMIYDSEVPVGGGTTTDPPPVTTPVPTPVTQGPPPPVTKPATASLGTVKVGTDGSVRVTVKTTGAGKLLLEAFAKKSLLAAAPPKGTALVGKVSATAKRASSVTLTLKPTGKAKSKLKRARKLAVTLQLTFTPAGGKAAKPLTKKATLRYSR